MNEEFESTYQLVFFASVAALLLLERASAWQRQPVGIARRWFSNIGLFLLGTLVTSILLPAGTYAFALRQPPGPLSQLPLVLQVLLTFVLMDFWRYWEHRWSHRIPLLWRLHLVHHSDTQVDVTTSERHHPLESLLGAVVLMGVVMVLGLPAQALGVYLLTATVVAIISHANLRLPQALDRALRRVIVTPDVHAVHHSDLQAETDSNYGSVLTIWDRLFGTYIDPERARVPHFGLGYFHLPKDTALLGVLRQPFSFRRDLDYPARVDATSSPSRAKANITALSRDYRDAIIGAIAGCLLVTIAMWPTVVEMTASWRNNEAYQYAWLVMPMVVYMLGWHHRAVGMPTSPRPDFTGFFVVIVAAICWAVATLMNINVGREFAFVLALQGVAVSALGWRLYGRLFPTLALMFLMIPCGDLLQPALRFLTVKAIEVFVIATNLPHSVDGFVIFVGTHRYIVVDECSGLAYVTLATFLGYCFGMLLYRSFFRIAALALLGAIFGIFFNAVRVNFIVLVDWLRNSEMDLTTHGTIQWFALFGTLGLLFYVLSRLKADSPTAPDPSPAIAQRAGPMGRLAPIIAGVSMLMLAGTTTGLPATELASREARVPDPPTDILGWKLTTPAAHWSLDQQAGTATLTLDYDRRNDGMQAVIIETILPTAKLPESKIAPHDDQVWREKREQRDTACMASDCVTFVHRTWQRDKGDELRHVYFAYGIGSVLTDSKLKLRAAHGWNRLTGGHDSPRLIAFTFKQRPDDLGQLVTALRMLESAANKPET